jgi:hypothetical protein
MKEYCEEVRGGQFPDDKEYVYKMIEGEEEKFLALMKK